MTIKKRNKYYSINNQKPESFLFVTFPNFIRSLRNRKSRKPVSRGDWHVPYIAQSLSTQCLDGARVTWIGHATFLIEIGGVTILTDPIFGNASFLYPRMLPAGIAIDQLPPIDVILLSHNHPDHMDKSSLRQIAQRFPGVILLVPEGEKRRCNRWGLSNTYEFDWWQTYQHGTLRCTFLPADHWSARGLFDKNRSLWGSWLIEHAGTKIYFAGDTAYGDHFAAIAQEYATIDIALMPIGPCEPAIMCHTHISGAASVRAFADLGARHFIPMHWGTFAFGTDYFYDPIQKLQQAWNASRLQDKLLHLPKVGQTIFYSPLPSHLE